MAVTATKQCVGIKIFKHPHVSDQNGNSDGNFDDYIDLCVRDAVELKQSIEAGEHSIENDERIVKNPTTNHLVDVEKLLELRAKSKTRRLVAFVY